MPQIFFDYWGAFVGLIAVIGVWIAWRQRRGGTTDKNTDIRINRSEQVNLAATDASQANVDVNRSKGVEVKIGDTKP